MTASERLVLVSDTHARTIPEQVWAAVDDADLVVHAGDWTDAATVDAFEARARRLVACWGNNDGPELRARMPEVARLVVGGLRVAVLHETGDARGRERRCDAWFGPGSDDPADVVVFGHSHIPWDTTTAGGVRLLNPGSPTDRRRQPFCTFMTGAVRDGALAVTRHDLPPRPARGTR
ncbi:metallophosphoesterase family protein [Actinomycetospora termitidis]|uniref:Phosphoesterase n=1 Tax=Actinomycetospora termitidis TaxID=3053470 RepID=A0ABT7M2P0_9PSEU|nr:metallophosphoesterase [Actinomycetospora sp. Odt1-22]MDL5154925.1 metallophosphoesterase [Actinomycetospora sp. Odt1-22]